MRFMFLICSKNTAISIFSTKHKSYLMNPSACLVSGCAWLFSLHMPHFVRFSLWFHIVDSFCLSPLPLQPCICFYFPVGKLLLFLFILLITQSLWMFENLGPHCTVNEMGREMENGECNGVECRSFGDEEPGLQKPCLLPPAVRYSVRYKIFFMLCFSARKKL